MADASTHHQADVIKASSSAEENVNPEMKKRKTHRLKQRFQVVRKLGQGTYGKVQLAINNETGQEVAIKTIKKSKVENSQDLIRIRREIQIMSSIHHPHIIHIYEVFENKDKIVLVMQYASGGELYDYVSYHKVLSDSDARRLFRQIATAIYYCHKNKICHRDLKLENILLDEKGNAKIADFGLSNVFDEKHFLQTFCGSPLYASPEIVRGLPYFGPEVDCWSLGVLLYTLVYGAMPFDGSNFKKLVKQISESSYYEPPNKSAGSDLIRKLLMPNPRDRATIIDICTDEWVNQDFEHSLLQVAEDLANLTPVRCDMLLALAPTSPKVDSNEKLKEEVVAGEGAAVPSNEQSEEAQSNKVAESNKRTVDNTSFSASTTKMDDTKKSKKKTKRAENDSVTLPKDQTTEQSGDSQQEPQKESPPAVPSEPQESSQEVAGESTADASLAPNEKSVEPALEPNNETTEKQVSPSESISKVSNASSSSMTSPKRPGRLSIPKIWDSTGQDTAGSPVEDVKKAPFIPVGLKVSEAKKVIERRCSVDSGSQLKRRDSLSSATEMNKDKKVRDLKKYTGRSLSLNLQEASKTKRETVNQAVHALPTESPIKAKEESESPYQSKPSTPISEEDKSLAKQIIKKNIARAKLMEKQQVSVTSSETGETTPLVSIENSNVSIIQNTPTSKVVAETAGKAGGGLISEASFNPSPITRSYKKVTFTKDGACIKESGKFYSHEGKDGYTTRVEKKSMVTHIINNDGNSNNVVNIQRSDSQSSSGSTDIFDDIFDDHWTGDVFSNVKSLFNNIFENSSRRFNERTSLRSRAESLERSTNDWFSKNRKSAFRTEKEDDSLGSSSIFDSQRSMMTSMSKFSSSIKSSFDKRFDDMMSPLSTRREQSKITYPNLPKFGSRFSRESSLHRDNDSFDSRLGGSSGADEQNRQDSTRRRVEQWLHSDDGKDLETYGTIGPKNFRRYVRTMTSNDSASNVFKRVQMSNTSETMMEKSAASLENCASVSSNAVPRDNEIEVRFSLDNLEPGSGSGPAVLTQRGPIKLSSDQSDSAVSTSADSGIKIAETSSLLEQLRTFGYKNLVSRRLSESSSTEDIVQPSSAQESSSDVNALDRPGAASIRREPSPVGGPQNVNHSVSETSVSFRRQHSREMVPTVAAGERLRKESDVAAPAMADGAGQDADFKSETVQERILRKSYYSRFNEDSRSSYTCRQRRRSMTRLNEHTSEFFSSSSSSSSILSSSRPAPKSLFYEPKSSGGGATTALSSLLSSNKSLADLASDISSRYSHSRGRQSSPRSTRSSEEDEADLVRGAPGKGTSRL